MNPPSPSATVIGRPRSDRPRPRFRWRRGEDDPGQRGLSDSRA